ADLARREPAVAKMPVGNRCIDAGDERIASRHRQHGSIVADTRGNRSPTLAQLADEVELVACAEREISHREPPPTAGSSTSTGNAAAAGRTSTHRAAQR